MFFRSFVPAVLLGLLPNCACVAAPAAAPASAVIPAGSMPTLDDLERRARDSLAMRALDAELEMLTRRSQAERASTAPRLYGAGGLSSGDEVLDPTRTRAYSRVTSEVGLRVPVLGSRARIAAANQRAAHSLQRREAEIELARRDIIGRLRLAYADYWTAQQSSQLGRAFLENEPAMTHVLALRTRAGLLLDSDRRELLTGFELARRELRRDEGEERRALQQLQVLSGTDLTAGRASYPRVRRPCSAESSGAFAVDLDPEILALDADLDSVAPRATTDRWRDISSDVRLGYQLTGEGYGERSGGSAVVGWSFEMPLDLGRQRSRMASAAESETRYLGLQRDLRRTELENRYRDLDAREGDIRQSQQFANARLQAAAQAVHERELRAARLAGDVTEQLLASRVGHYGAERARIDAYRSELLWFADWARFEPRACGDEERGPGLEAAPVPRSAPAPVLQSASQEIMNPGRAVYLWSSEPWLTGSASGVGAALSRLKAGGTGTVMVSLDADQIEQAAADGSRVRRLIGQAAAAGIRTELLLGDSAWILPRHRSRLLHIVQQLRELPFSGLHLDLEPNMLDDSAAGTARLLPELVETLRLARDLSPWPVGCSLHPRYLTAQVNGVALGDRLTQLGIATTLMIYVANPQRVVEIAQPILVRFPRLRFRIALSIEHTLSREESLFTFPEGERAARIAQVEQTLAGDNFGGIALQPSLPWMAQWLKQP